MNRIGETTGIYQLKITLQGSMLRIWRRFVVPADIPLDQLHHVIQIVMGWKDMHLHRFVIDGQRYCDQPEDPIIEGQEEKGILLRDVLGSRVMQFEYDYDFGDNWIHLIEIEDRLESRPKHQSILVCSTGASDCPPEDSGGIDWYTEQQMKNPNQHEGESFDLECINTELRKYLRWSCG